MTTWTRVVMNQETRKLIRELPFQSFDTLEISGRQWSDTGFRSYASVQYPEFDLCTLKNPSPTYDLVIAEQVFEHILWPYRAGKNVYAMLRPNGYFLITTPFLLPIHDVPIDCSRWTPLGMKYFLAECGFPLENVNVNSWGNKACVIANLKGWVKYSRWWHSLENSPQHPVVVWAIAQRQ